MLKSIHTTVLLFLAAALFSGCSPSDRPEGLPTLYPCEITVIQDGAPLAGANVTFMGDQPWAVGGGTDDKGVARIFTHGKFEGAPIGTYSVLISKTILEGGPTPEQLADPNYSGGGGTMYRTVERKFGVQASTPLSIKIVAGKNSETFDIGKAVREAQGRP